MKFTCPRRYEDGTDNPDSPLVFAGVNRDVWDADGTCSYCGSIKASELISLIKDGAEIGPTDKSYKIYIDGPASNKFYFQHFFERVDGKDVPVGQYVHQFIELYNNKTMRIGMPGYFYVKPFFMGTVPKT